MPGHRNQPRDVPDVTTDELDRAIDEIAAAVRTAGVVTIVGTERPTAAGREIVCVVLDADGSRLGEQAKTQIDPSEEAPYVAGSGRRTFTAAGLTFGIAICHEAFRYPEISRALTLDGAQVIFVPHWVTTEGGSLPTRWIDASNPYNEKALMCRALENTVYVAPSNNAGPDQGSATCIIAPDGSLVAQLPYGQAGVVRQTSTSRGRPPARPALVAGAQPPADRPSPDDAGPPAPNAAITALPRSPASAR